MRTGIRGQTAQEPEFPVKVFVSAALGLALLTVAPALAASAPSAQTPAQVPDAGAALLAANAKDPAVKTLASGLQYRVVRAGPAGSPSPKEGDVIKVHYEGRLVNGEVFDSSFERDRPALMPLGNLIPGWMEALPLMHVGDEWTLYVPPALGYGDEGAGPIPPGSVLIFRLQFLGMLSAD
jgi:FKBP-type peptidyl-prolyl cis-trans isomerase FklB